MRRGCQSKSLIVGTGVPVKDHLVLYGCRGAATCVYVVFLGLIVIIYVPFGYVQLFVFNTKLFSDLQSNTYTNRTGGEFEVRSC